MLTGIRRRLGLDELPPAGAPRQLCLQSGIWALGFGAFLAGSAVFFTRIVGLSSVQVASGIGVANVAGLIVAAPSGFLADRIGYRRSWAAGALIEAIVLLAYPVIHGFAEYLGAVIVIGLARSLGSAGQSAYGLEVLPADIRVRTLAFMRTTSNVGIAAGALISGIALAIGTRDALLATPLISGAAMGANALFVRLLPRERRGQHDEESAGRRTALRDVRFMVLALANGLLTLHGVLTAAIVPLWAVTGTRAPDVTTAVVYIVNTSLIIALQVRVARNADAPGRAGRLLAVTGVAYFFACGALALSRGAGAGAALGLIVTATIFLTAAELWQSSASWALLSRLARPRERGAYSGVWYSGDQLQSMIGPAVFVWLVAGRGPLGWLGLGLFLLALGAASPALVRWAERGREATAPAPAARNQAATNQAATNQADAT